MTAAATGERRRPAGPVLHALRRRLEAAAAALAPELTAADIADNGDAASILLDGLVRAVDGRPSSREVWLLLVAMNGSYPVSEDVEEGRRRLAYDGPDASMLWLLETAARTAVPDALLRDLELMDEVVVDVGSTAVSDLHTGIQQVVRSLAPIWHRDHQVELVGWWPDAAGLRRLTSLEAARVTAWDDETAQSAHAGRLLDVVLVPWNGLLVLPDSSTLAERGRLAALAAADVVPVVGVGHDCIPVVSAHLMPPGEAGSFARYLEVVKHMRRIAAVSASAATEFAGFASALPTQGLPGPVVTECRLGEGPRPPHTPKPTSVVPQVACVGSYEPRKNHLGLLHAAEVLWREGLEFCLVLVGGMSWTSEIPERIAELQAAGRPLTALHAVDDARLADIYAGSSFTVFPSLHEGFGLPVAESLGAGTPVVTTDYGSTAESAAAGGALLIDPRDDAALVTAMRTLLTVPEELARLRAELSDRPRRSWQDFADDLWSALVAPELRP